MGIVESNFRGPVPLDGDGAESVLVAVVGWPQRTNLDLVEAWLDRGMPAALLSPEEAVSVLGPGDVALARLDVLPTLDGIEGGLDELDELERRGVRVLNRRPALVCAHDKLRTARRLVAAQLPHPKTVHLPYPGAPVGLRPPVVVKPRFGSWGVDIFRCATDQELAEVLQEIRARPWFRRHGALLQDLVPSTGRDLRILVAGGRVVGAIQRIASPGEWRTNVSRGAARVPLIPSPEACELAIAAAAAIGADFVGVDLLPLDDGYVVIEVNGAVEFDHHYALAGRNVYTEIASAVNLPISAPVRL